MSRGWAIEFRRLFALVACYGLFGWLIGQPTVFLVLALVTYVFWNLYNLYQLDKWLKSGQLYQHPDSNGIWEEIFIAIYQAMIRQRKRRKDLANVVSRFREATAALPDAVVVINSLGEIEWCNRSAEPTLGLTTSKHTGQRFTNFFRHPDFVDYLNGNDFEKDLEVPSPLDKKKLLQARVIGYGRNQQMIVVRDVTRIHKLEVMRTDFVANISHELRTPLTVLQGYLEMISEDCAENQRVPFEQMQNQTHRMQAIINDLMMLTALESDSEIKDVEAVDMDALLKQIHSDSVVIAEQKNQSLDVEIDSGVKIWGAWDELYSAISNLIVNAIKYSPDESSIRVEWTVHNNIPRLSVIDDGFGIAAHHIPRITERFYRVDKGRARTSGGTGLGLAIVKHILSRHDAKLEIESEFGKGSRFTCVFSEGSICETDKFQVL